MATGYRPPTIFFRSSQIINQAQERTIDCTSIDVQGHVVALCSKVYCLWYKITREIGSFKSQGEIIIMQTTSHRTLKRQCEF